MERIEWYIGKSVVAEKALAGMPQLPAVTKSFWVLWGFHAWCRTLQCRYRDKHGITLRNSILSPVRTSKIAFLQNWIPVFSTFSKIFIFETQDCLIA